jgi:cytoskeletal protein RodZ
MPTLGEVFREGRYRLNLSLDQAEAETKIRKKYLIALEEDDYSALPAPVYAHGFIQIYAEYLQLDPVFSQKLYQPPERAVSTQAIRPAATGFRDVRPISLRSVVTLLVVLLAIAGVVALYAQYLSYTVSSPVNIAPRPTPLATATRSAVAAAPIPTATPTETPLPSPTPRSGVDVMVNVTERTWLRVIVDGQSTPVFEGEIQAGEVRTWTAKDRMDMRVGNAGGVDVTVNGMRQGKLGASGEVKNVTWGRR